MRGTLTKTPTQSDLASLSKEELFSYAKKIHKENLNKVQEKKVKVSTKYPREVPQISNNEFRESGRQFNYYTFTLCNELGFDTTGKTSITSYSKTHKYYTVHPESDSYNFKSRIIKHFNSKYKNTSECYEWVDGIKIRSEVYKDACKLYIDDLNSKRLAILVKKYGEFKSTRSRSGNKVPVKRNITTANINTLKENYSQYLTEEFSKEELDNIEEVWDRGIDLKSDKTFKLTQRLFEKDSMMHNIVALPSFKKRTPIIAIDIDTHSFPIGEDSIELFNNFADDIRNYLLNELGLNIVLFERSRVCRGIHIYIKLKSIHNKELIEDCLKDIIEKKYSQVKVEYRNTNKPLRLPFCWDYENINIENGKIITSLTKSLNKCFNLMDEPIEQSNEDLSLKLIKLRKKENRDYENKIWIWDKRQFTTNRKKDFSWDTQITRGNRVSGEKIQWKLLNKCLLYGKSLNEFIDLSIQYRGTSKDLNEWSSKEISRRCSEMYSYALKSFNESKLKAGQVHENTFYSNIGLLSKKDEEVLEYFISKMNFSTYQYWNNKKKKDAKIVFSEILGSIKWQELNDRKVLSSKVTENPNGKMNGKIKSEKALDLEVGFQFSDEYFKKLKIFHKIETNPRDLFNKFKEVFLELYIHKNGSTYIPVLHSCKQWIGSFKFNWWFNSLFKEEVISYSNNINIYNININDPNYTIMFKGFQNSLLRGESILRRNRVCGDGIDII